MYLDLTAGIVKSSHHAIFNEAWYLQPHRPPAAQLLYDLGIESDTEYVSLNGTLHPTLMGTIKPFTVTWPPTSIIPPSKLKCSWDTPPLALYAPLPLGITDNPNILTAKAAQTQLPPPPKLRGKDLAMEVVHQYLIGPRDMEMIYMLADPYGCSFEASLDLPKCNLQTHWTAGLCFITKHGHLVLAAMDPGTPRAEIDKWRTQLHGTWLVLINGTPVHTVADAQAAFALFSDATAMDCTLVFSHPEISLDISNRGVPIMSKDDFSKFTHDQLNNCIDLLNSGPTLRRTRCYNIVLSGNVRQYKT
jgi:hypothetical protein